MSESSSSGPSTPAANTSNSTQQKPTAPINKDAQLKSPVGKEASDAASAIKNIESSQEPAKPAKKAYKYKADGKEITEELDDNELNSRLALSKAADARMREAAELRKSAEKFIKQLQENPMSILSNEKIMGNAKFRELAESYLLEQIKAEQMTPEQRLQAQRDKELEEYKTREQKQREAAEQEKAAQLTTHWQNEYQKTIIAALEQSGLPKNAETIAQIASLMKKSIKAGLDVDVAYLANKAREGFSSNLTHLVANMDGEQLVKLFGDDLINKVRKYDLSKWQPKENTPKVEQIRQSRPTNSSPAVERTLSPREFRESLLKK